MNDEQSYQMTKRPTGMICAFGVGIGIIFGFAIAYQVLSFDIVDHAFFVGIIMEAAIRADGDDLHSRDEHESVEGEPIRAPSRRAE